MQIIIENSAGQEVGRWDNLKNPTWPDGGSVSGMTRVGEQRVHSGRNLGFEKNEKGEYILNEDEQRIPIPDPMNGLETYTIKEVVYVEEGSGPRLVSRSPVTKIGDVWTITETFGDALPPPPDPKPGDSGYDHVKLRRYHMPDLGDEQDEVLKYMVAIKNQQVAIADAINGLQVEVTEDPDPLVPTTAALTAASLTALVDAMKPLTDLPAGLDTIIGEWQAVKQRFPKE